MKKFTTISNVVLALITGILSAMVIVFVFFPRIPNQSINFIFNSLFIGLPLLTVIFSIFSFLLINKIFKNWKFTWLGIGIVIIAVFVIGTLSDARQENNKKNRMSDAQKREQTYQKLVTEGYFPTPTYLPEGNYQLITQVRRDYRASDYEILASAAHVYDNEIGPSTGIGSFAEYTCNAPGEMFQIDYHPFALSTSNSEYKVNTESPLTEGVEAVKIGDTTGIYKEFTRAYFDDKTKQNTSITQAELVWKTVKSTVTISTLGKCKIPKVELLKIAESIN